MKKKLKNFPEGGVVSANEYTGSSQGEPVTDEQVRELRRLYGVE